MSNIFRLVVFVCLITSVEAVCTLNTVLQSRSCNYDTVDSMPKIVLNEINKRDV
jgi:hypothetical protein